MDVENFDTQAHNELYQSSDEPIATALATNGRWFHLALTLMERAQKPTQEGTTGPLT